MTPDRSRATASASEPQPDQQTGERSASTELRPDESGTDGAIEALKLDVQNLGSLVRDLESKVSQTMTGFKSQMSEIVQLLRQPTTRVGVQGQMGAYGFGQPSASVPPQVSDPLQYRDPWGGGFRPPPPPPGPPPYIQNQWRPGWTLSFCLNFLSRIPAVGNIGWMKCWDSRIGWNPQPPGCV